MMEVPSRFAQHALHITLDATSRGLNMRANEEPSRKKGVAIPLLYVLYEHRIVAFHFHSPLMDFDEV